MNKKMNKGLTALKKVAPKAVKSMGYKKGGMMKMALGGITGMSGGMDEDQKNSATGMTTMSYGGVVAGKKARTGHMDMRKNGMMYGGMVKKKKG